MAFSESDFGSGAATGVSLDKLRSKKQYEPQGTQTERKVVESSDGYFMTINEKFHRYTVQSRYMGDQAINLMGSNLIVIENSSFGVSAPVIPQGISSSALLKFTATVNATAGAPFEGTEVISFSASGATFYGNTSQRSVGGESVITLECYARLTSATSFMPILTLSGGSSPSETVTIFFMVEEILIYFYN